MGNEQLPSVTIALSPAQVEEVLSAASRARAPSISAPSGGYLLRETGDPRLSRSLVRGLSILTCFGADGAERGIVEIAEDLGLSASTAYRYANTLVELGLLHRSPRTRKYRPASPR